MEKTGDSHKAREKQGDESAVDVKGSGTQQQSSCLIKDRCLIEKLPMVVPAPTTHRCPAAKAGAGVLQPHTSA